MEEDDTLRIGDWIISTHSYADEPDKISISRRDGEGGDFNRAAFVEHVAKFYKEHF
jgi:hypothetical protein